MRYLVLLALVGCYRESDRLPDYKPIFDGDTPVGSDAGAKCQAACARLHDLGCPEGGPTCLKGCTNMAELQAIPAGCWADAGSVDAAKACGGLRCARP